MVESKPIMSERDTERAVDAVIVSDSLDIIEVLAIFRRRIRAIGAAGAVVFAAALTGSLLLPVSYDYLVLVRAASLEVADAQPQQNPAISPKAEALRFLDFHYSRSAGGFLSATPRLISAENDPASPLFEIRTRARSPDEAKSFAQEIIRGLQDHFAGRLEELRAQLNERITLLNEKVKELTAARASSAVAAGPNVPPDTQLVDAELSLAALKAAVSPLQLHDFSIEDERPAAEGPSFPRPFLFALCAGFAAVCLAWLGGVLMEERRRRTALNSRPLCGGNS